MKIWELDNMAAVAGTEDKTAEVPAATLWVIQPQASNLLLTGLKKKQNMEDAAGNAEKQSNLWIPVKKRKFGSKLSTELVPMKTENQTVDASFQSTMKITVFIGQCFGLFPVDGIFAMNPSKLKFTMFSWRCGYAVVSMLGQGLFFVMCFYSFMNVSTFEQGASVVFYGTNFVTLVTFLLLAREWPALSKDIVKLEVLDAGDDAYLPRRCTFTSILVLCSACFEHILSMIAGFSVAKDCNQDTEILEAFTKVSFPWIFTYFSYSTLLGAITMWLNFQSAFIWNYTDVFVIVISFYLTSRLEQVNQKLSAVRGKYLPATFWRSIRESYCRATQMVRRFDKSISIIVFVCFANNLFFICLQLFHTLELFGGYEHAVYFLYSFMFLLSRTLAVSLIAAKIHSAAKKPGPTLYEVPSPVYCVEVQRFLEQVNGDPVALTGLQFFNVTRGLVLTVAGTIVTYELVLVQFNASSPASTQMTFLNVTTPPPP